MNVQPKISMRDILDVIYSSPCASVSACQSHPEHVPHTDSGSLPYEAGMNAKLNHGVNGEARAPLRIGSA